MLLPLLIISQESKFISDGNDKKAEYIDKVNIKGRIEFKDVDFTYPTRKEL